MIETIAEVAARFDRLLAEAATAGITLSDERELHARFLTASLAGETDRCRQMIVDTEVRIGAARAARLVAEQRAAAEREIASLRAEHDAAISSLASGPRYSQGRVEEWRAEFAAAAAAGDVAKCRELAAIRHNMAFPHDLRVIEPAPETPEQIRARQEADAENRRKVEQYMREAARAELLGRFPSAGDVLAEVGKCGELRLDADGVVLYSGAPLDDLTLRAVRHYEAHIRNALGQRWFDRIVLPAPEAEERAA